MLSNCRACCFLVSLFSPVKLSTIGIRLNFHLTYSGFTVKFQYPQANVSSSNFSLIFLPLTGICIFSLDMKSCILEVLRRASLSKKSKPLIFKLRFIFFLTEADLELVFLAVSQGV
jgi:hypothetical protein